MDDTTIPRLEALLDAEHAALIEGDFQRISDLMEEKQALIATLSEDCSDRNMLSPVRNQLQRNHRLFDQSLAGLRNAASRLGVLAHVRKALHTYDETGQRETMDAPQTHRLEKRA